ncbi:MAG TPA: 4Fe-4S dicluster domain-containing protein [Ignavibacteria bacterium]|nr:4Fe-4S dicluster domain-containing protein [Ignavibacteria bacterium]
MEYPKVDPEICTGCGACMEICPVDAIVMENGIAKIIVDKCRGCYACQNACPTSAIS